MDGLVIVLVLIIISYANVRYVNLVWRATKLFGEPNHIFDDSVIWLLSEFKLCIASDTKLPVQLYFTWEKDIVRPRNELYQILARVCSDSICYDAGSSKFTIKDNTIETAFEKMSKIKIT